MAKMVRCKTCGAEIASSAKACPNCGAKRKKHTALAVILVIVCVLLIASVAAGGSGGPEKVAAGPAAEKQTATAAPSEDPVFHAGDTAKLNDVLVTLVSVTESAGSEFNKPSEGNIFVLCEFEIENASTVDLAVSSMLSFEAYADDYAASLSLNALLETDMTSLDGSIAAGKKMKGVVGYEINQDWSELEIHFMPSVWSGKEIVFVHEKNDQKQ